MIRDRIKGLARRVRNRGEAEGVGQGFGPAQDKAFAMANDSAEGSFQVLAAAMVSSWEVLLTDLGRALVGRVDEQRRAQLIERASDALVPTQTPIQGAGRKFTHALKTGVKEALESGQLQSATGPMIQVVSKLPDEVVQGWWKTTEYLEPLFELLGEEGLAEEFKAGAMVLGQDLHTASRTFSSDMAALPLQGDLQAALIGAIDRYSAAAARIFETEVYRRRELLVRAARALPEGA